MNTIETMLQNFIGALERPVDERDWPLSDVPPPTLVPPGFKPNIYNQGSIEPSCGAGACATLENFNNPGAIVSMQYIWIQNRLLDGLPASSGSDMRTLFKALQNSGSCDESLLEANVQEPIEQYVSPTNITQALVLNAMPRRINFYGFQYGPFTWTGLQQTVNLYHVVLARINLGTRFYTNANGAYSYSPADIFPLQLGTYVDDHFIVLISQDLAKIYGIENPNPNFQYFINDWGSQYGQDGVGWFDATYLPHIVEIGAVSK
jgi:hypothetical protein